MTQREPQNDDFMTVDPAKRRLHLREVGGSPAGRYDGVGSELRAARMRGRLDLDSIGVKLRISPAYLLAIEEGRFGDLPGHVYVYGFLRTYAQHLGLDAEAVIRQYKAEAANPKPTAKLDFPSPMDRGRLPTLRILLMSVALAGLVYAGWSYLTREDRQTAERVAAVPPRFLAAESPAAPAPAPALAAASPATPAVPAAEPPRSDTTAPAVAAPSADTAVPALPSAPSSIAAPAVAAPPLPTAAAVLPPVSPAPAAAAPPPPPPVAPPATATAPAAPPPAPVAAVPSAPAPAAIGEDPRRRVGDAPAAPARTDAAVPGQDGVAAIAARRLNAATERPGASAVTPPPAGVAAPPAPAAPAAAAAETTGTAPADEDDPDTPTPPPTPRVLSGAGAATDAEVTVRTLPPPAATAALPPVPAVPAPAAQVFGGGEGSRVTVQAELDSWVQVTTASGQQVFARMMRAGDRYVVPNRPGLRLMTGNAGGLRILVDGTPTPLIGTLGAVVRDVALDPDRLVRGNAAPNEPPGG